MGAENDVSALRRLERIHRSYGGKQARDKLALVRRLGRVDLRTPKRLARLHEILCFLRAYPDDPAILARVERELARFPRRSDLVAAAGALGDSGIAGTAIRYRFFWPMARWLARSWPRRLEIDWDEADGFEPRLRAALPVLVTWVEAEAVKRSEEPTGGLVDRLRGSATDATFVLDAIERLPGGPPAREAFHDAIDIAYVLRPGPGGPSRTHAKWTGAPIVFRTASLERDRPDLLRELERAPVAARRASAREGSRIIDLAREAMVTRSRDLDAFAWGNPRDVEVVDDGDGLVFALIGMLPERRLPLPAVHGWLTLRNGVPIGYVQSDTLLGSSEIAFNTFETFRGGEAGHVFARVLAVARHLLGARSFSIEPYQLGRGNAEGLASGAWWFYYKLGFRPNNRVVQRVAARELRRMRRDPGHRSSAGTLEALAAAHLSLEPDPGAPALLPLVPGLGLRLSRDLGRRGGGDRRTAVAACVEQARERLGAGPTRRLTAAERLAWERLAPVICALRGVSRWTLPERRALATIVLSKAGESEIEFSRRLDAHPRASRALARLLTREGRP